MEMTAFGKLIPVVGRIPKTKTILVMKMIAFLLLTASLHVGAAGYSQKITLSVKKTSLEDIFQKIRQQSGYEFIYDTKILRKTNPVTIVVKDASIEQVLDFCFLDQPFTYEIVFKTIVVKKKIPVPLLPDEKKPFAFTVNGKLTNKNGTALQDVSVSLRNSTIGTVTDASGRYNITMPDGNGVLIFSSIGYTSREEPVKNRTEINIVLQDSVSSLDNVVIVGYGTQKKIDVTGSVSSVQEKDFTTGVNNSALQLLNGRAAGVYVSQSSSAPGGGVSVRVRGAGSINSSNEALVVIDGLTGASTSSLSPDDIESIQVLKDASAAAIYGSRAANGVILITTKKGKKGVTTVNYNSYVAVQNVARKIDVLNGREYMQVLNGILGDQGQTPRFTQNQIDAIGKGTNWQDEVYSPAIAHNHQLSFSGGADNSRYYIGLNYLDHDGVITGSNLKKYNLRLNYEINPSKFFKVGININANRNNNTTATTSESTISFDPTLGTGLDSNGKYEMNPLIALDNPLALLNGISQVAINNRTYGTISADYKPIKGLTATLRLGADIQNTRSDRYTNKLTLSGLAANGIGAINTSEANHWMAEFFTNYEKNFGTAHNLSFLGGVTFERNDNRGFNGSVQNFLSDITLTDLLASGDGDATDNLSSDRSSNQLNSFLGRVNYRLLDKFLATVSVRVDGTSRFSDNFKYAVFPSLALGWRLSQEPFIRNIKAINELKLRVSYGQMGNQGIGDYQTRQTFIAGGRNTVAVLGNQLVQGVGPSRIPNPDIKWETTEEYNAGVDFELFNHRLTGSVEYYVKNTRDQLFNKPLPTTTGFASILVNFGEVRNQGIDLLLESRNTVGEFKWSTTFTLSTLKNKVVQLPDYIPQIIGGNIAYFAKDYTIVREGAPMRSFYGYEITGIFQKGDDIAHSAQPTAQPGYPVFKDQNNDGKINATDRTVLGSPFPEWTVGLNNEFGYKGFNLSVLIIGVQGLKTLDNNIIESLYPINFDRNRIAKYYLDRWTPDNPGGSYPSGVNPSAYGGALAINSLTVTDASFFRLKTVTLSYDFKPAKKKIFRSASIYAAGDNLFTKTKFEGLDPDANSSGTGIERATYVSYPLSRTIRIGVNLGF